MFPVGVESGLPLSTLAPYWAGIIPAVSPSTCIMCAVDVIKSFSLG